MEEWLAPERRSLWGLPLVAELRSQSLHGGDGYCGDHLQYTHSTELKIYTYPYNKVVLCSIVCCSAMSCVWLFESVDCSMPVSCLQLFWSLLKPCSIELRPCEIACRITLSLLTYIVLLCLLDLQGSRVATSPGDSTWSTFCIAGAAYRLSYQAFQDDAIFN